MAMYISRAIDDHPLLCQQLPRLKELLNGDIMVPGDNPERNKGTEMCDKFRDLALFLL